MTIQFRVLEVRELTLSLPDMRMVHVDRMGHKYARTVSAKKSAVVRSIKGATKSGACGRGKLKCRDQKPC